MNLVSPFRLSFAGTIWLVVWMLSGLSWPTVAGAAGYTPEHPEVEAMVDQLIAKIEGSANAKTHYTLENAHYGGFGEYALMGYAHYKARYDATHPIVVKGVEAARTFVRRTGDKAPTGGSDKSVYSAAICAMLLAEIDAEQYRGDLQRLYAHMQTLKRPHGGYTYRSVAEGDVSQTQYAMLALWKLDRLGIDIDYASVVQTAKWLLAVQEPKGGWPYQGKLHAGGNRGPQTRVTPSMTVAGGSALLIAGDILRAWGATFGEAGDPGIPDLPEAIKLYLGNDNAKKLKRTMAKEPMVQSIGLGDSYLTGNSPDPGKLKASYPYYQLYTMERYYSFREVAMEQPEDKSPGWYNDGVNFLKANMKGGSLDETSHTTSATSNAFGILFLIRSTKKSIAALSAGAMTGGWGLPDDTSEVKVDGTQIKGKELANSVTDLLSILEEDDADSLNGKSIPDTLKLAKDPKERKAQIDRLERLARGSESWQARRVAMRLLGQSDEMRIVPTLIYGLTDPDPVAKRYARDGLRFISRKFDGFGLPRDPDEDDVSTAVRKWKQWYLTMNPKYVFLN